MRCPHCSHEFALGSPGMGFSDPPGIFLLASVAGFILSVLSYGLLSIVSQPLAVVVAGMFAVFAVGALVLIPGAMSDSEAYGPQRCPQCGKELTIHPWSR